MVKLKSVKNLLTRKSFQRFCPLRQLHPGHGLEYQMTTVRIQVLWTANQPECRILQSQMMNTNYNRQEIMPPCDW